MQQTWFFMIQKNIYTIYIYIYIQFKKIYDTRFPNQTSIFKTLVHCTLLLYQFRYGHAIHDVKAKFKIESRDVIVQLAGYEDNVRNTYIWNVRDTACGTTYIINNKDA